MDLVLHTVQPVAGAVTLQYLLLPSPWLTQQKMGHPIQQKHIFPLAYYAESLGTTWKVAANRFLLVCSFSVSFFPFFFFFCSSHPYPSILLVCIYGLSLKIFLSVTKLVKKVYALPGRVVPRSQGVCCFRQENCPVASSCVTISGTQTAIFAFCVSGCWDIQCRQDAIHHVLLCTAARGYLP